MAGAKESEWNRALEDLQMDFKILPVGVAEAGSWKYAFIYDIAARHYPSLPQQATAHHARPMPEVDCSSSIFGAVGVARRRDVLHLFGWPPELADRTIHHLVQSGFLTVAVHPQQNGEWLALPSLCR